MYSSLSLIAFVLLLFSPTFFTLTTTPIPIVACKHDYQCSSTAQFCNTKQDICMLKYSLNSACQHDHECITNKCHDQLCRHPCKEDKDCSHTKEYCAIFNYCNAKHCGLCTRDVHCANHKCHLFHCASHDCTTALKTLQKRT